MLFRQALGVVLSEHRYKNQLTLRQVVKNSQARVSYNYLWEIEQGKKEPSSEVLNELAKCIGTDTADLVMKVGLVMNGYSIPDNAKELLDTTNDLVSR
jgi:transcriptional regulator with XRE-family HTH domain